MRALFPVVAFGAAILFTAGCSQMSSPTLPSSVSPAPTVVGPKLATAALADSSLNGSAYQLTGVSGTSLTFTNTQNTYTVAYDSGTTFRRAVLQSWAPTDPFYQAAVAYNNLSLVDSVSLTAFVGGNVRIVLVPPNPISPTDPYHIASFQPIP